MRSACAFVALILVQCSFTKCYQELFDSETNEFFTFIFAAVLAHEVSYILLPAGVGN